MSYKNIEKHLQQSFIGKNLTNEEEAIVIEELRRIKSSLEKNIKQTNNQEDIELSDSINNIIQDILIYKKVNFLFDNGILEFNNFMYSFDNNKTIFKHQLESGFQIEKMKVDIIHLCQFEKSDAYSNNTEKALDIINKVNNFVNDLNISKDIVLLNQVFDDLIHKYADNNTFQSIYRETFNKYFNQIKSETLFGEPESIFLNHFVRGLIDKDNLNGTRKEMINTLYQQKFEVDVEKLIDTCSYIDENNPYLNSKTIYQLFSDTINKHEFSLKIREKGSEVIQSIQHDENLGLCVKDLDKRLHIIDKIIEDCIDSKIRINNKIKRS